MFKTILSVSIAVLFVSLSAEARRDQRREVRQQSRIAHGVKNGELTRHEAKKLRRGQKRVDHAQEKAMEDGVMTDKEKMKIEKMQDVQNKRIYREKHDNQERNRVGQPATPATPADPGAPGDGATPAVPAEPSTGG